LTESVREELDRSTKLAFDRTYLAEERTILAWIRTATSLITFGFAIFSFFGIPNGAGHAHASYLGPRIFSLALISVGLLSLLFAAVQRRRDIKAMKALYPDAKGVSMATTVGLFVACLGVLAFGLLIFRI
jgi:putative membrane protein